MIRINTMHIPAGESLAVDGEEPGDFLELDPENTPSQHGPVYYDLTASMAGRDLLVQGKVRAKLNAECARCLKQLRVNVEVPDVCHLYPGTAGQIVDISQDIREDVLLTIPVAFHCRKDCKGLCPSCGADLNEGPCSCGKKHKKKESSPWDALDSLNFK